jgi:hypothetical protein
MKAIKFVAALLVLAMAGVGSAWADHFHHHGGGHVNFGFYLGPGWGPWYYPPTYYYPPYYVPPVVVQPQPQVYVEQAPAPAAAPAAPATGYWYYCAGSRGYYPYVKTCPGGWQKVAPQPE